MDGCQALIEAIETAIKYNTEEWSQGSAASSPQVSAYAVQDMHQQVNRLVEATLALLALACMKNDSLYLFEDPGETTDNLDGRVQQQIMAISMSVKAIETAIKYNTEECAASSLQVSAYAVQDMHQQVNRLVEATLALLALACMRDCPLEDPGETTDNLDGRVQQQIMAISAALTMSVKTLQKVKVALTKIMKEIGDEALVAAGAVTGLQETVAAMEAQGEVDLKNAIAEMEGRVPASGTLTEAKTAAILSALTVPVHDDAKGELSMAPHAQKRGRDEAFGNDGT